MLNVYTAPHIEDAIHKLTSQLGVPCPHYLASFLKAIADEQLALTPQLVLARLALPK